MPANSKEDTSLELLVGAIGKARELARRLLDDPQLDRLVYAFRMLPEQDREPILQVIEKDAAWRRIVESTDGATGISVRPNRQASLYVHVLNQPADPIPDGAAARDAEIIRLGVATFVEMLPLLFQDAVHAQWTAAADDLARASDPEQRRLMRRLLAEVSALLDAVEASLSRD